MLRRSYDTIRLACLQAVAFGPLMIGCGGSAHFSAQAPITVSLPISTVLVMPAGSPVNIPIQIESTSETAIVSVNGLPGGVRASYAASDTNPSGSLTFSAISSAMTGTYMPIVFVSSAGQSTMIQFTLIVKTM